jgi:hypothetical protein
MWIWIGVGIAVPFFALWIRVNWSARQHAIAMALRRFETYERKDETSYSWTFDFIEMLAIHEIRSLDWPTVEGNDLHKLCRREGPSWEVLLHPECAPYLLASLEQTEQEDKGHWPAETHYVNETKKDIHRRTTEWQALDDHMAAQLEAHYQLFIANYTPIARPESLDEYWRRLVALEKQRKERREKRLASLVKP